MKITSVATYTVPPRWLFLRVETDDGTVGWGEPVVEGRAATVAAAVDELADYLVGQDPRNIEDIWTVLYRGGFYRGGPIHMSALAGIDQALWDIKGKHHGVPVHDLLGGPVRDRIKVYSWIGGDRPAETAAAALAAVERGFTAVKMNGTAEMQFIDSLGEGRPLHPERRHRARGGGPGRRRRRGLPRAGAQAHGEGPHRGARALQVDVHRGAGAQRARRRRARRPAHRLHPDRPRRAAVLALGLQARPRQWRGGHHPAGPVARRRHHRDPQDRDHGRGLRRRARPALPPRPDRPRHLPADRRGDLQRRSSRNRASASTTTPATTSWTTWSTRPSSPTTTAWSPSRAVPGLGIEVNEEYVRERALEGHRWRNPIWRHADGSFAEW